VTNKYLAACCLGALLIVMPELVAAQTKDPIAGVWERTSNKNLSTGLSPDEPSR
jgi:hypothetical protein